MIENITENQESLFDEYTKKWSSYCLGTKNVKRDNFDNLIKSIYADLDFETPKIEYFSSLTSALKFISETSLEVLEIGLEMPVEKYLIKDIEMELQDQISEKIWWKELYKKLFCDFQESWSTPIDDLLWDSLLNSFPEQEWEDIGSKLWVQNIKKEQNSLEEITEYSFNVFSGLIWSSSCCLFEFCLSELNCSINLRKWETLKSIVKSCDYIFLYKNLCLVSTISENEKSVLLKRA